MCMLLLIMFTPQTLPHVEISLECDIMFIRLQLLPTRLLRFLSPFTTTPSPNISAAAQHRCCIGMPLSTCTRHFTDTTTLSYSLAIHQCNHLMQLQ